MSVDDERDAVWKAIGTADDRISALQARMDESEKAILKRLDAGQKRMTQMEEGLRGLRSGLAENTELTRTNTELLTSIRDAQVAGRTLVRVANALAKPIKWAGALAAAIAAIWVLIQQIGHGGKLP